SAGARQKRKNHGWCERLRFPGEAAGNLTDRRDGRSSAGRETQEAARRALAIRSRSYAQGTAARVRVGHQAVGQIVGWLLDRRFPASRKLNAAYLQRC